MIYYNNNYYNYYKRKSTRKDLIVADNNITHFDGLIIPARQCNSHNNNSSISLNLAIYDGSLCF